MSRIKMSIGVLLACGACLLAVGAATAAAGNLELHVCAKEEGTPNKRYSTSNCEQGTTTANGQYTWKRDVLETTVVSAEASSFSLASTVSGIKFVVSCSGLEGSGGFKNVEKGGAVGSEIGISLTGCVVSEPAGKGCKVPASIKSAPLSAETGESTLTYSPASGTKFTTVSVSGCSVSALNGEKEVTGTATSVVPEMGPQQFTAESSSLKFAGQKATFVGSFSTKNLGGETVAFVAP